MQINGHQNGLNKDAFWVTDQILSACGGTLLSGKMNARFYGTGIDSRRIRPGMLFIALKGVFHDGHDFVGEVLEKGVKGLIINGRNWEKIRKVLPEDTLCIGVDDTTKAMGDLAAFWRRRFSVKVVAITGSNGKTSTKDITLSVLSRKFNTLATEGNLNNQIGVPLTLFRLTPKHRWAVLELGMNHPGEIKRLAEICAPDAGGITNIAPAHLLGVGDITGVVKAKAELFEHLNPSGLVVLNADDPKVASLAKKINIRTLLVGKSPSADIRLIQCRRKAGRISCEILLPSREKLKFSINSPAEFMAGNALFAVAFGCFAGLSPADIKAGIENFSPLARRMHQMISPTGIRIIDDTYNANPESVKAALRVVSEIRGNKRSAAILGDMLELGEREAYYHRMIGEFAFKTGINRLYLFGKHAEETASGALLAGMEPEAIFIGEKKDIVEDLLLWAKEGDIVLVKGSRGASMEEVVEYILKNE